MAAIVMIVAGGLILGAVVKKGDGPDDNMMGAC
jgi:hypothetical protein